MKEWTAHREDTCQRCGFHNTVNKVRDCRPCHDAAYNAEPTWKSTWRTRLARRRAIKRLRKGKGL